MINSKKAKYWTEYEHKSDNLNTTFEIGYNKIDDGNVEIVYVLFENYFKDKKEYLDFTNIISDELYYDIESHCEDLAERVEDLSIDMRHHNE